MRRAVGLKPVALCPKQVLYAGRPVFRKKVDRPPPAERMSCQEETGPRKGAVETRPFRFLLYRKIESYPLPKKRGLPPPPKSVLPSVAKRGAPSLKAPSCRVFTTRLVRNPQAQTRRAAGEFREKRGLSPASTH